ncbi:extracellular solute-binding protein [Actinomyces sp. 186855]|nr:extracellular solute-binding protein [Actinomyces sp. 186855]MCL3776858.1 extracellular solute-binding protein [Actinomyces sp. AC-20-1]MCL3790450.1 extracellular solute-binding protein [Actinomyces sp. 187325]MCL3792737.1 extracellular solute-binding protein [Actinomyces sp. 186855]MCL3794661.1 extracellular solute-binding protein [Actinomyces sp. 217892]
MLRGTSAQLARRTFLGGSLTLATAATLAACGAGGSGSSDDGDTLTVLVEAGGHGQLQPIADQFQAETGTKVSFVELPYDGLYNRLSSELNGNAVSFDVAALDAIWLPAFQSSLTPLDSLFTDEVKGDIFPALVEEAAVDGTFVGMPVWTNAEILFYRKDLFEDPAHQAAFPQAYGCELTPPATWQQYHDAAEYFFNAGGGDYYGTDVKGAVETEWLATLSQAGEEVMVVDLDGKVSLGSSEGRAALDFYTGLLPFAPSGAAQLDWAGAQNLFNQGQLALMRFWAHAYRQVPEGSPVAGKVGVAPMIGGDAGVAGVPGAWYLSIAQASKKQDKALEFIRYAYDHNELSVDTSLGLASRISVLESRQDDEGFEHYAPLLDTLNAPATRPRPAIAHWQQIVDTALIPMIQKAVEPGADNAALLEDAKAQVESVVG